MIDDIMLAFDENMRRVNHLLSLYSSLSSGAGRKSKYQLEVLRACVVLLHSTLEDYLRNVLRWRLPTGSADALNGIGLSGVMDLNRRTFKLGELLIHRDLEVAEVIRMSVEEHLQRTSFNRTSDLVNALREVGVTMTDDTKEALFPKLELMMQRRHHIVHQADRNDQLGSGRHRYKSLSLKSVKRWQGAVDQFVLEANRLLL